MIDALLFDLDGTLFDRDATVVSLLNQQVRAFVSLIGAGRESEFVRRVIDLDDHGHRDKREVYDVVATEFGLSIAVRDQLVSSFLGEYPRHCKLGVGVMMTLRELRQRGKRIGIITNGAALVQNAAIDALGVRGVMDAILISETEGLRKPDPALFRRAADRVGVPVDRCCFVGDHPVTDTAGAIAAGCQAFWKRTSYWRAPEPLPTIEALPDLLHLVS